MGLRCHMAFSRYSGVQYQLGVTFRFIFLLNSSAKRENKYQNLKYGL